MFASWYFHKFATSMAKNKILLVEDEEHLLHIIKLNLELDNYSVISAINGVQALVEFRKNKFDLVILDVMLPEMNGFDVCEIIRKENLGVPILFLTVQSSSSDRIRGLKLGADDYLTKPFNLEELLLRVQVLLKRSYQFSETSANIEIFSFGENQINFISFQIIGNNNLKVNITKREIALLKLLISRKEEVVSREEILDKVWGTEVFPSSRTIDNYILAFRKYFEKNQREPQYFHSIRGVGYKFSDSLKE